MVSPSCPQSHLNVKTVVATHPTRHVFNLLPGNLPTHDQEQLQTSAFTNTYILSLLFRYNSFPAHSTAGSGTACLLFISEKHRDAPARQTYDNCLCCWGILSSYHTGICVWPNMVYRLSEYFFIERKEEGCSGFGESCERLLCKNKITAWKHAAQGIMSLGANWLFFFFISYIYIIDKLDITSPSRTGRPTILFKSTNEHSKTEWEC
jgi:hypothetical protein